MRKALFLAVFLVCSSYGVKAQYSIKIVIDSLPSTHPGDTLYIAGDFNSWNPNDPNTEFMKDANTGKWTLTVPSAPANVYEVKVTRGATEKTECGSDGKDILNRKLNLSSDTTLHLKIAGWQDDFAKPKGGTAALNSLLGPTFADNEIIDLSAGVVYLNRKVVPSSAR